MPRTARASVGGVIYHVLNRGNGHGRVFHDNSDYQAFVTLITLACERLRMRVLGYCLMPNHFHLVVRPYHDEDLGRWMQWLMTSHVRRYHKRRKSSGHVWQGRFKAFPVQNDEHLFTVLRYVERNPLRAGLVTRSEAWPWSSLTLWKSSRRPVFLFASDMVMDPDWCNQVNAPLTAAELQSLLRSVNRGTPFGQDDWVLRCAARLGLEASVHPRGRPRTVAKK